MNSRFCRTIAASSFLMLIEAQSLSAEDLKPVLEIRWESLKDDGKLKSGEIVAGEKNESDRLKLVNDSNGPKVFPLCELVKPPITTPSYAIRGKVRYQNVNGVGFLEMWNYFDGGGHYFSRTLGTEGPMQMVTGTSSEREFILPFHTGGKAPAPNRLEVNLVLNGSGTVEVGPLELVAIESIDFGDASGAWFDGRTAGILGAVLGTFIGLMGGIVGTLVGIGKGKPFVVALASAMLGLGLTLLAIGIVAVTFRQPFPVYFVLFLSGGMMTLMGALIMGIAPMRYRQQELRRMQALDG